MVGSDRDIIGKAPAIPVFGQRETEEYYEERKSAQLEYEYSFDPQTFRKLSTTRKIVAFGLKNFLF